MIIFDFFAGTGSSTQAFQDAGHTVFTFEKDPFFTVTETCDIMNLSVEYLLEKYGQPDFVWASPPCTAFSVASIGHHWLRGGNILCLKLHKPNTISCLSLKLLNYVKG